MVRGLFTYLVKPKNSRSSATKTVNGGELLLNTDLQDHNYVSRLGVVEGTSVHDPLGLEVGDEIIVHHNVFRRFRDIRGIEKNSRSYYTDNLYFVQPDQVYAYKRDEEWKATKGYCFIKPIKDKRPFSNGGEYPGVGIVKYSDGIVEQNALVGFKEGLEYEFHIDGERLFRVPSNLISIKYEYQGDEEEYNPGWSQSS